MNYPEITAEVVDRAFRPLLTEEMRLAFERISSYRAIASVSSIHSDGLAILDVSSELVTIWFSNGLLLEDFPQDQPELVESLEEFAVVAVNYLKGRFVESFSRGAFGRRRVEMRIDGRSNAYLRRSGYFFGQQGYVSPSVLPTE